MLKITSPVLRSSLVVAAVALLPLTATGDDGGGGGGVPVPTPAGDPPVRSCTITTAYPTGSVQIIAGPNSTSFPVTVKYPSDPFCPSTVGTCLKWDYRWIYTAVSPSYSFLTLDSDLILANAVGNSPRVSAPITGDPTDVGFGVAEVRVVRFTANATYFNASIYTATNAQVGKVTVGFKSGSKKGFCGIQGAEKPPADTLLSQPKSITTSTLGCTVDWTLSPDGCVTAASTSTPNCTITTPTIGTGGPAGAIVSATCGAEISVPGSSTTCRWNSFSRTNICVTVP